MRIELLRPRINSYDGFLLMLSVIMGIVGAVFLLLPPEPAARMAGGAILAISLLTLLPQKVLAVSIEGDTLVVRSFWGRKRFPVTGLGEVHVVDAPLLWRVFGAGLPGYHAGLFRIAGVGIVKAYASRAKGPFTLVERPGARPLLLSPSDPAAFAAALKAAR